MNMLYVLIFLALLLLVVAIGAMFWAIRNRQFDDLESQGWSVVLDDDQKPPSTETTQRLRKQSPPEDTGSGT